MSRGVVFNLQRFSVHDGPGIRTTVFLKGCPLTCVWCHNPEGIDPRPEVVLSPKRCIECGECVPVCPRGLTKPGRSRRSQDSEPCLVCGACAEICPTEARQVAGRSMAVKEVLREVLKDRIFYQESGGGVTFSGGEPLGQPEFLRELLAECRSIGVHAAVDTCGLAPWEILQQVALLTDLFLFDLKHLDDAVHRQYTGVSNRAILANLHRLAGSHERIWLRVPVIPGVNDEAEHLAAIGQLAAELQGVERVCLLPYHPLGEDKRRRRGQGAMSEGLPRPASSRLQDLVGLVSAAGVPTGLGG